MNARKWSERATIVLIVLLLVAGPVQGQEPEPEKAPGGTAYTLAQPPYTMNYQGYLTDSGGTPLNGTYNLAFRLYDAAAGGNMEWGTEVHNGTQVTHGIFQVTLGSSETLYPEVFDEALFLAVRVNGTWVSLRQPLHAVPYAFGLVPGAEVEGISPTGQDYALFVRNTRSSSFTAGGIYAEGSVVGVEAVGSGGGVGLLAESEGGEYAIWSRDATYSVKGYAGPDTYVWVPVHNAVIDEDDAGEDVYLEPENYGLLRVEAGPGVSTSTSLGVLIPIQVERPYGRDYYIKSVEVYYRVDSSAKLESGYIRGRDFATGDTRQFGINTIDGTSISFDSYTINATSYYTITTTHAPTTVELLIDMPNANSTFYLYGIRLQLKSHH